ncbi:MAG TPA: PEP/pyruvate-binding domain-containing protein [Aeromicrobium sp.]|nr:PEP/pyruvate-binding domain-containing protein [Aeromicrobium sp.]
MTSNTFAIVDLSTQPSLTDLGKKAANLAEVATIPGVRTPKGFALPGEVLDGYLENFRTQFLWILRTLEPVEAHRTIEDLLIDQPLDSAESLIALLREHFPLNTLFAVRSSAHPVVKGASIAEDSEEISLAGQYSSFLRVPAEKVPEAVSRCAASLFNARSIEIFKPGFDTTYIDSTMTVLIQEMVDASACGVMMTIDPMAYADGIEVLGIEASYGACEAIVAGKTQGDLYLVDRNTGAVSESELGSKRWRIDLPIYGSTASDGLVAVSDDQRVAFALTTEESEHIAALGRLIEEHFGLPQDIEFVLDANREVVVTQARPITTLKEKLS